MKRWEDDFVGPLPAGPQWMFVPMTAVEEYDDPAFPKDMTGYTKGTKSQYAKLGLGYPLATSYKYVTSPYGPRTTSPAEHMGIDLRGNGIPVYAVADE